MSAHSDRKATGITVNQTIPEQLEALYTETENEDDVLNLVSRSNFALGFASALLLHQLVSVEFYNEYSKKITSCVDAKLAIMEAALPAVQKH